MSYEESYLDMISAATSPLDIPRTGPLCKATGLLSPIHTTRKPELRTSSYWKVPDESQYLTSVAVHESDNLCAVASGSRINNLFVYELENPSTSPILTHHQTITLPEIHSLQWVSPASALGAHGNVLVSGHKQGIVHMTLLPETDSSDIPAEILTRFDHRPHLPSSVLSTRIRNLALPSRSWSCMPSLSVATLCSDHLFVWDPTRTKVPIIKQKMRGGPSCFHPCASRDGIIALGGRKGVSIRDLRAKGASGLSPPDSRNAAASAVQWSAKNDNLVAAVHDRNTIHVWDIRVSSPVSSYVGHSDKISAIEWSRNSDMHIVSASNDGTIRLWNITEPSRLTTPSPPPSSASSPSYPAKTLNKLQQAQPQQAAWRLSHHQTHQFQDNELDMLARNILQHSQPMVLQHNRQFTGLKVAGSGAVSIDTDGYFGYHRLRDDTLSPALSSSASDTSDNDFLPPLSPISPL